MSSSLADVDVHFPFHLSFGHLSFVLLQVTGQEQGLSFILLAEHLPFFSCDIPLGKLELSCFDNTSARMRTDFSTLMVALGLAVDHAAATVSCASQVIVSPR